MPVPAVQTIMYISPVDGLVKYRFKSINIEPTYQRCNNFVFTPDDFGLMLSVAGEAIFQVPSDVNAALAAAMDAEFDNFFTQSGGFTQCDDNCTNLGGGSSPQTVNDATASAAMKYTIAGPDVGDTPTCVDQVGGGSSGAGYSLDVSITAPAVGSVDLSSWISGVDAGLTDDSTSFAAFRSEFLADGGRLLYFGAGATIAYWSGSNGQFIVATGGSRFTTIELQFGPSAEYYAASTYDSEDPPGDPGMAPILASDSVVNYVGGTVTDDPQGWRPTTLNCSHIRDSETSSYTITATLPISNDNDPPDPDSWYIKTAGVDARFQESGSFVSDITYSENVTDPGFRSACQWDITYTERRPFQRFATKECPNILELQTSGVKFLHPPGVFPNCTLKVWHEPDEA